MALTCGVAIRHTCHRWPLALLMHAAALPCQLLASPEQSVPAASAVICCAMLWHCALWCAEKGACARRQRHTEIAVLAHTLAHTPAVVLPRAQYTKPEAWAQVGGLDAGTSGCLSLLGRWMQSTETLEPAPASACHGDAVVQGNIVPSTPVPAAAIGLSGWVIGASKALYPGVPEAHQTHWCMVACAAGSTSGRKLAWRLHALRHAVSFC